MPAEELNEEPNLFASFVTDDDAKFYLPFTKGWDHLQVLEAKLAEYNETFAQMNLVLFNAAMEHIVRISRIIGSRAATRCSSAWAAPVSLTNPHPHPHLTLPLTLTLTSPSPSPSPSP